MTKVEQVTVEELPSNDNEKRFLGSNLMQHVVRTKGTLDTVICCKDGRVGAHRMVLTAASEFMGCLLREQRNNEVIVLVLPDFRRRVVEALLCLAYTGKMFYAPEDEDEVLAAIEALQFVADADLSLTMVTVKPKPKPKPVPPVVKTNPSNGAARAASSINLPGRPSVKKLRMQADIKKPIRRSSTISRRRKWLQLAKNPNTFRKSMHLKAAEHSGLDGGPKTVRVNLRKLPMNSVQLSRVGGNICVEEIRQGVRFFHTEDEVQAFLKKYCLVNTNDSASSDGSEGSSNDSSVDDNDRDEQSEEMFNSTEENLYGDDEVMSPNIMDVDWNRNIENLHELETQPMEIGGLPSPPQSTHDDQGVALRSEVKDSRFAQHDDFRPPDLKVLKTLNI